MSKKETFLLQFFPLASYNRCSIVKTFPSLLTMGELALSLDMVSKPLFCITNAFNGNNLISLEITHGFDDKGRQFDLVGNMKQWWNNATVKNFRERAQCIIDQYSKYRIDEVGLYMNGRMTQGENIAVSYENL